MPLTARAQRVLLSVLACDILGIADACVQVTVCDGICRNECASPPSLPPPSPSPSPPLAPIPFRSTAFLNGSTGAVVGCSTDETTTHLNGEVVAGQCCKAGDPADPANCQRYVGGTVRGRTVDVVERWGGDRQSGRGVDAKIARGNACRCIGRANVHRRKMRQLASPRLASTS